MTDQTYLKQGQESSAFVSCSTFVPIKSSRMVDLLFVHNNISILIVHVIFKYWYYY